MWSRAGKSLRIDVTADVRVSAVQRERLVRRVLLALSRYGPRVRRVTVRLAEPKNPLGGVDQRCRIRALLQDGDGTQADDVRTEAIDGSFEEAVVRASAQLAKRLGTVLDGDGVGRPDARPPVRRLARPHARARTRPRTTPRPKARRK
jgi:hypothetical protein